MGTNLKNFRDLAMAELPAVYRMAFHWTSNAADADDLVQETYLRAFKAEDSFKLGEVGVRPWLLRILHNARVNRAAARVQRRQQLGRCDSIALGQSARRCPRFFAKRTQQAAHWPRIVPRPIRTSSFEINRN